MLKMLDAKAVQTFKRGPFRIQRIRPGAMVGSGEELALGPLSVVDHATLEVGTLVGMHQHRNDEILSYIWRGVMEHKGSNGNRIELSPHRLMLMGAGTGIEHEESSPVERVEMLQIFVRPEAEDLPPRVQFWDRPVSTAMSDWQLIAGPEASDAPLKFRQRVMVFDIHARAGEQLEVPTEPGITPWVYLIDGTLTAGDKQLNPGDALADSDAPLPPLNIERDAMLVAILVDTTAHASRAGTVSGL